eukprot:15330188-Ditylum_brightwellii.AAC.1
MPVDDAYEKDLGSGRLSAGFVAALPGFADVLRAEGYTLQQPKDESAPLSAKEAAEMNHAIDAMIKAYEGATTATKSSVDSKPNTPTDENKGEKKPKLVTIEAPTKIYRPKPQSMYREPDLGPDLLDGVWVQEELGKSLKRQPEELPERNDIATFDCRADMKELTEGLKLEGCPEELHGPITNLVKEYWDVFCADGLRKPIRGFSFQVDTGNSQPVCCKTPRYGPRESQVIRKLIGKLEDNGVIEDDDGPWGAQVVLAAKPHQEGVAWQDLKWRLCVSYRKLNQVTRPFTYPIPRCDDAVEDIDTEAKYFIAIDLESGYWQ